MVVSEKLIGGLAVSVLLLPRDLSPLFFFSFSFAIPLRFSSCSRAGICEAEVEARAEAEKLERRERSERKEKKEKKRKK